MRYSLENPQKYIDVNIHGFLNIINQTKINKIKNFIYASSSSVYGDSKKFPLKEDLHLNPKNIYGLSKKLNEQIAQIYSNQFNINCIGLRFFTIYGDWGRPDMFMLKLFKAYLGKKTFYLNNFGNHKRDFTYIHDVTAALYKIIKKIKKGHQILNICSNRPIKILDIINHFKKNYINVKLTKMHRADVKDTHGSNKELKELIKILKYLIFMIVFIRPIDGM